MQRYFDVHIDMASWWVDIYFVSIQDNRLDQVVTPLIDASIRQCLSGANDSDSLT